MSYKVLTDGNGGPVIRVVGLGDYIRFDAHNAALVNANAERDALAAQVEAMRKVVNECAVDSLIVYKAKKILREAPQQCLANLRADAIKQAADLVLMAAQVPPANTIPDDLFRAGIRCGAAVLIARSEKMRGGAV